MNILVTGANGQLGNCLQKIAPNFPQYNFFFQSSTDLDITDVSQLEDVFQEINPDFCINAAAYTAVDNAEVDKEKAFAVNAEGVGYIANFCKKHQTTLIHISTDYVFDGETNLCYSEDNFTNPLGVYGQSKLLGEELAIENNPKTIILRTSWLYSEFNKNFVKTMLNLFSKNKELNIVDDQYGQPTNANDLAKAILQIIISKKHNLGIFHFSNYPETTWYNFAKKIADFSKSEIILNPIPTSDFPTPAKRPFRSTLCLDKIEDAFGVEIQHWENSLENCIELLVTTNA
jgi:dTDP-4-dehydrorhamnose reductase